MPGKKPTIKQIAAYTGVSIGTVHRAIYGKEGVGEETRKRILEAVEQMNYTVDETASSMKRKSLRIAVVLPKPVGEERFFLRGIWSGIKKAADSLERYRVEFVFIESEYNLEMIAMELQKLYDTMLDDINGLITLSDDKASNEWISRFYRQGVTVVLLASYGNVVDVFCSIKVNHKKAGELAGEFLFKTQRRQNGKVLLLSGNQDAYTNLKYGDAFAHYLKENMPMHELIQVDGLGKKQIEKRCRDLLKNEDIEAVFCCNARNTFVLCELLDTSDRKDIILIGTDVFKEIEQYLENDILTAVISQSNFEQGEKAVSVIYEYLTLGSREKSIVEMPFSLVMKSNYKYFSC
ncbi:MAG: substrate-binding domain-containing protein [Lachnospiraceae bacterium]